MFCAYKKDSECQKRLELILRTRLLVRKLPMILTCLKFQVALLLLELGENEVKRRMRS